MPTWKKYKLGEITTKIGSGATPRGGENSYKKEGISLIRSQNILDFQFSLNGLAYIDDLQAKRLNNVTVIKNDVLLNITGDSVARVCQVPKTLLPARVNQHVAIIRPKESLLNACFLKYYLLTPFNKNHLLMLASSGGTRKALTKEMIENLDINLPPLPTQHRIAEILGALDDKIELNLQMNKTLEEMAMALYKHWFVDFGPFKDGEFEDSELGLIPKGWEVSSLQEHFDFAKGLSYKGKYLSTNKDDIPLHNLNSIYEGGYYKYEGIKYYNGEFQERHKVYPGDLIVANTEQGHKYLLIGSPTLIPKYFGEFGIFTHHLYRVRPKTTSVLTSKYLYYNLLYKPYRSFVTAFCNGTTVNMLQKEGLMYPKIIVPQKSIIDDFESKVNEFIEKSEVIYIENQTLKQTRDYLLPKLISGKVEVNTAEKEIKEMS